MLGTPYRTSLTYWTWGGLLYYSSITRHHLGCQRHQHGQTTLLERNPYFGVSCFDFWELVTVANKTPETILLQWLWLWSQEFVWTTPRLSPLTSTWTCSTRRRWESRAMPWRSRPPESAQRLVPTNLTIPWSQVRWWVHLHFSDDWIYFSLSWVISFFLLLYLLFVFIMVFGFIVCFSFSNNYFIL